jgi:hypothetical protein
MAKVEPATAEHPELEYLFAAAHLHGQEVEPDHEVGDLQALVRTCWDVLTPEQRERVVKASAELIDTWGAP